MNPVAMACVALGDATSGTMRSIGTGEAAAAADALRAMERRDWAVRVLDAWEFKGQWRRICQERGGKIILSDDALESDQRYRPFARRTDPDAARLAAAEAVWAELPESVRFELGEKP